VEYIQEKDGKKYWIVALERSVANTYRV